MYVANIFFLFVAYLFTFFYGDFGQAEEFHVINSFFLTCAFGVLFRGSCHSPVKIFFYTFTEKKITVLIFIPLIFGKKYEV